MFCVGCVLLHCFNAPPYIFAVVNCADIGLRVFYSRVLTHCRIFLQLCTALIIYVHYSDKLYNNEQGECV